MAVSDATRDALFRRASGRCECQMVNCPHYGRCNRRLLAGRWHAHHKNRYGGDGLANLLAMCIPCHQRTPSYGKPR